MSRAWRAAGRMAIATGGTAFVAGSLHFSQAFLAVLAAQLTVGAAFFSGSRGILLRLGSAIGGALGGLGLLILFSDQYWFSLPVFGVVAGWGTVRVARCGDPAAAILFCMGFVGMFAAGIVEPAPGIVVGLGHLASLTTAVVFTRLAQWIFPVPGDEPSDPVPGGPQLGVTAVCTLLATCAAFPSMAVVATIASLVTVLTLGPGLLRARAKLAGGLLGVLVSFGFLTVVAGSGNDLAVFLVGLAGVLAGFEWLACALPGRASLFRQAGALFAVAATMLPRPTATLFASTERQMAVLLGLGMALVIHWVIVVSRADPRRAKTVPLTKDGEGGVR